MATRSMPGAVRVLHLQRAKGIGGSERHLLFLLPGLAEAGLEVCMCVLRTGNGERFAEELRAAGVPVTVLEGGGDVNPRLLPALVGEIRRFRPQIVHTHLVHADLYGQASAALMRVPGVSSVHGAPDFYRHQPYRLLGATVGKLAARRIAISEHVARFVRSERLATPERIRTIPYGIDADGFVRTGAERVRAREAFSMGPSDIVIGVASRLIPGKGHDVLIDSFVAASRENPYLRLFVAGEGPLRESLEAQARRAFPGSIRFLGFVPEIADFMVACDALAFPTQPEFGEGFGLATLEAMAAGRPVISSDVGPLTEIVVDAVTGYVIPARSRDGFTRALLDMGNPELRQQLGAAGKVRADTAFSLKAMVDRTIDVYAELV